MEKHYRIEMLGHGTPEDLAKTLEVIAGEIRKNIANIQYDKSGKLHYGKATATIETIVEEII